MTPAEKIIDLTIQQHNVVHPGRKISIVFGFAHWEQTLQETDPNSARQIEGSALMQYRGFDFGLLFGGPPDARQIMVSFRLRPAVVIEQPWHWQTVALLSCDLANPDPPMAVPIVKDGAVVALAYPHFPLDGFKWWFIAEICDKLLAARARLLDGCAVG